MGLEEKMNRVGDKRLSHKMADCLDNSRRIYSLLKVTLSHIEGDSGEDDNSKQDLLERLAEIGDTLEIFAIPASMALREEIDGLCFEAESLEDLLKEVRKGKAAA